MSVRVGLRIRSPPGKAAPGGGGWTPRRFRCRQTAPSRLRAPGVWVDEWVASLLCTMPCFCASSAIYGGRLSACTARRRVALHRAWPLWMRRQSGPQASGFGHMDGHLLWAKRPTSSTRASLRPWSCGHILRCARLARPGKAQVDCDPLGHDLCLKRENAGQAHGPAFGCP
jgi:hypothetical protein